MAKKANKTFRFRPVEKAVVAKATTVAKRRGRPARTRYQKVVIMLARLFNERLQTLFLKKIF